MTGSSVEVEDFLLRGSFPFTWLAVCEDEDLRFLVVLGWEFFLLCLFEGFPVIKKNTYINIYNNNTHVEN